MKPKTGVVRKTPTGKPLLMENTPGATKVTEPGATFAAVIGSVAASTGKNISGSKKENGPE